MGKRVFIIIALALASFYSKGQNCITTHFTAMIIQGEAMGRGIIGDDLGMGLSLRYGYMMGSKLQFTASLSHLQYNIDYMQPGSEQSTYYYGKGSHTSAGVGFLFFPFSKSGRAAIYSPFRTYIGGSAGLALQHNETVDLINMTGGYTVFEGNTFLPYGEVLIGMKFRMNPNLSFDVFAAGRTTFSDEIDGLAGTGAAPDLIGRVGIGICSKLR